MAVEGGKEEAGTGIGSSHPLGKDEMRWDKAHDIDRYKHGMPTVATFPFSLFSFAPPPPQLQCNILLLLQLQAHPPPPAPPTLQLCGRQRRRYCHWWRPFSPRPSIHQPNQNCNYLSIHLCSQITFITISSLIIISFDFRCCSFCAKTGTCCSVRWSWQWWLRTPAKLSEEDCWALRIPMPLPGTILLLSWTKSLTFLSFPFLYLLLLSSPFHSLHFTSLSLIGQWRKSPRR